MKPRQSKTRTDFSDSRSLNIALLTLLVGILAIRIIALKFSSTDLFYDEAQYWTWSEQLSFGYFSKPPLIAVLIAGATGLCGDSEFCIRLPSPILHMITAAIVYWIARRLYSAHVGFWSALTFATLPGVSFSSGIVSTDVPLLSCWAMALLAFTHLAQIKTAPILDEPYAAASLPRPWWPALLLGVSLGLGLNAKYAMVYFIICALLYIASTQSRRWLFSDPRLYMALALGAIMIAPNIYWNVQNSFTTLSHTADNAKWDGALLHPLKALEFFATQFGVFGPILFTGLLVIVWRAWHDGLSDADALLIFFSLPILAIIFTQSLLSRAHANWAATAYVGATILVVASIVRRKEWHWLYASLAMHLILVAIFAIGNWQAGKLNWPGKGDPHTRTLGWKQLGGIARNELIRKRQANTPYGGLIAADRALSAELLYYLRDEPTPLRAWRDVKGKPKSQYELTRPYRGHLQEPILLISRNNTARFITKYFYSVELIAHKTIAAGEGPPRRISFHRVSGFKLAPPAIRPHKVPQVN